MSASETSLMKAVAAWAAVFTSLTRTCAHVVIIFDNISAVAGSKIHTQYLSVFACALIKNIN